jgi:hypothetical protein
MCRQKPIKQAKCQIADLIIDSVDLATVIMKLITLFIKDVMAKCTLWPMLILPIFKGRAERGVA